MAQTYKLLQTKTVADGDDDDWASLGTLPPALFTVKGGSNRDADLPEMMADIKGRWINNAGVFVAGRGQFAVRLVRVIKDTDGNDTIEDSVENNGTGEQPLVLGGCRVGDKLGVWLGSITAPVGATKLQVYIRTGYAG